jgi:2-dehydropantoate 2-reductase
MSVLVYYNGARLAADHVRLRPVGEHALIVADDAAGRTGALLFERTPVERGQVTFFYAGRGASFCSFSMPSPIRSPLRCWSGPTCWRRPVILDEAMAMARPEDAPLAGDEAARTLGPLAIFFRRD